jgi:hypothetical protein
MDRKFEAVKRYIELRGMSIEDIIADEDVFVCRDEDDIVFAEVFFIYGSMSEHRPAMPVEEFEEMIFEWFAHREQPVMGEIRYDIIEVHVLSEDRAILRHEVNAKPLRDDD